MEAVHLVFCVCFLYTVALKIPIQPGTFFSLNARFNVQGTPALDLTDVAPGINQPVISEYKVEEICATQILELLETSMAVDVLPEPEDKIAEILTTSTSTLDPANETESLSDVKIGFTSVTPLIEVDNETITIATSKPEFKTVDEREFTAIEPSPIQEVFPTDESSAFIPLLAKYRDVDDDTQSTMEPIQPTTVFRMMPVQTTGLLDLIIDLSSYGND